MLSSNFLNKFGVKVRIQCLFPVTFLTQAHDQFLFFADPLDKFFGVTMEICFVISMAFLELLEEISESDSLKTLRRLDFA